MQLRGTVYTYYATDPARMLRFIKEYDGLQSIDEFRERVRAEYPIPDLQVEFGPIDRPWRIVRAVYSV